MYAIRSYYALARRGFVVAGNSKEEVEELFEIRAVLEGYSLRVVCGSVSEEIFKELDRCINKAEEALRKNQIERVFICNTRFHDTLHNLVAYKGRLHRLMVDMRKNRITSYNVCYTKLLRPVDPLRDARDHPSLTAGFSRHADGCTVGRGQRRRRPAAANGPLRITSYNVCYTKLLRNGG